MDTSDNSVDDIKQKINRIKSTITLLNSEPQDCSDWQNLTRLIDIINTDTTSLSGQQYFILFDSRTSSSAAPNMNLQQAIKIMEKVETNLNGCSNSEKDSYILKVQSIKYRLQQQLNNKNSQLTVRSTTPKAEPPTIAEMYSVLSKRTREGIPTTLSTFSTKIGGPSGAVGSSGARDAQDAQKAALERARLFEQLAGSIHDVVEDESIKVQDLNTIASINLQLERSAKNNKLDLVRQTIEAIQSNPRLLDSYRPETLDALVAEMVNAPDRHLNNQVWREKLRNLLEYILTRFGEAGIGLVATLAKFFSTTRDEFIDLMPATISAAVLLQILSGISWMGAPMGTQLTLLPANMSFTHRIFDILVGNAQRMGAGLASLKSPLVPPLLVAGLLLIVVSLLPQKYMDKLRDLVINLLKAIKRGTNIAIRNATALLIYAIDKLYINRSRIFLGTCRMASSIASGTATGLGYAGRGAMNFASGVASGARNVARGAMNVARCILPAEMLSIASTWMATQMATLQGNMIEIFSRAASQAVTTASIVMTTPDTALEQLQDTIMRQFDIRLDVDDSVQPITITIATIDAQVGQDNNDINSSFDPLLDGALDSALGTPATTDVGAAIQQTVSSRVSSRNGTPVSSPYVSPSSSQEEDFGTQQISLSPPVSPPYTPVNLTVIEQNNNITVKSFNQQKQQILESEGETDNEESGDEGGGGPESKFYKSDSDSDIDGGRRRKSYRRRPKTSTKKKQYRRRVRNTRRRQKRNTKKYRRIRRR
jgi:hypothetical protein